ncbi:MAG TPA: lysophospholipid acyltransferase family protein [Rhizomicrobium sp.]|jgi:1-acyl-sn-glycerol-3-phosphate acyltransferase
MTLLRSALFFLWFAIESVVVNILSLPALILPRRVTVHCSRFWSRATLWGLKVFAGITYEVRGPVPKNTGVLVASKHMSMWDTLALYLILFDPAAVAKRSLLYIPFYGWYIWKAGVISIDREGKASALRKMVADAKAAMAQGRPILIFPEGHRQEPGAAPAYKPGVAGLYTQFAVACVPVALNSGLFWTGFIKKPGKIVVEFLEAIPPGLKRAQFMRELEIRIETATARLVEEGRESLAARDLI